MSDQGRRDLLAGAVEVVDGIAVLGEQRAELRLEVGDAGVELLDVARELADATRGSPFGQAVAELEPLETAQHLRPVAADRAGLGDRIELRPVGAQALDRLASSAGRSTGWSARSRPSPDPRIVLSGCSTGWTSGSTNRASRAAPSSRL
jgi:hypothetical protein